MDNLTTVLLACLPSAITAFCFWLVEHRIDRQAKAREERLEHRERMREKQELILVRSVSAAIVLGTATAKAVERIPDTHCNGDMHAALEYARAVKKEQDDFLTAQGIEGLYREV